MGTPELLLSQSSGGPARGRGARLRGGDLPGQLSQRAYRPRVLAVPGCLPRPGPDLRQQWAAAAARALLTAVLSGVDLGAHYPTDVIGSIVVSAAAVLAWLPVWNRIFGPRLAEALTRNREVPRPGR